MLIQPPAMGSRGSLWRHRTLWAAIILGPWLVALVMVGSSWGLNPLLVPARAQLFIWVAWLALSAVAFWRLPGGGLRVLAAISLLAGSIIVGALVLPVAGIMMASPDFHLPEVAAVRRCGEHTLAIERMAFYTTVDDVLELHGPFARWIAIRAYDDDSRPPEPGVFLRETCVLRYRRFVPADPSDPRVRSP